MFEQNRSWLETIAQQISGRRIAVVSVLTEAAVAGASPDPPAGADRKSELKAQAMADAGVQALLEVFPAEIRDVEEM
jgi:BRCT domain type II-containing protein